MWGSCITGMGGNGFGAIDLNAVPQTPEFREPKKYAVQQAMMELTAVRGRLEGVLSQLAGSEDRISITFSTKKNRKKYQTSRETKSWLVRSNNSNY